MGFGERKEGIFLSNVVKARVEIRCEQPLMRTGRSYPDPRRTTEEVSHEAAKSDSLEFDIFKNLEHPSHCCFEGSRVEGRVKDSIRVFSLSVWNCFFSIGEASRPDSSKESTASCTSLYWKWKS